MTKPTIDGVSRALDLSDEAASVLLGMVEHCLNARVCMGMDEGIKDFDTEEEHDFVKELRALLVYVPVVNRQNKKFVPEGDEFYFTTPSPTRRTASRD